MTRVFSLLLLLLLLLFSFPIFDDDDGDDDGLAPLGLGGYCAGKMEADRLNHESFPDNVARTSAQFKDQETLTTDNVSFIAVFAKDVLISSSIGIGIRFLLRVFSSVRKVDDFHST
jgi:hypothetical protein